ncbi:MAG: 7TM domain-containing protein, partial [Thiohalophilus sp.]
LTSLPLDTQHVYRIILMIPIGALLLVVLRNVIGVKTFGTFMPILIALAFRETQLLWGIIFFTVIVGIGLSIRFYLENLKLLLVPRLASVLTIVILLMMVISVLSNKIEIERGLSVALFPMVILAMTIERMSIVWEERGAYEAIQQGLGSLLVAALAYLLITNSILIHIIFTFPELLLIVLATMLLLGRYTGYRLFELIRFKAFYKNV